MGAECTPCILDGGRHAGLPLIKWLPGRPDDADDALLKVGRILLPYVPAATFPVFRHASTPQANEENALQKSIIIMQEKETTYTPQVSFGGDLKQRVLESASGDIVCEFCN